MDDQGRLRRVSLLTLVILVYLFLYVPLVVLLIFSFNSKQFPSPWTSFTLDWYRKLFRSLYLWKAFGNSLIIALCATGLSLFSGVGIVFYAAGGGRVGRWLGLFYGSLIIPETVLAVSLLSFFSMIKIPLGIITLIVAHTILGIGFVVPIVYARYKEMDLILIEASKDLGATPIQTFFRVILPLLKPTLITTALLVFIISFDDFILSYFCAGSSVQTLSLYILSMLRTSVSPVVNALSSILLFLSSILIILFFSLKARLRFF